MEDRLVGSFVYDSRITVPMDDRTLAHLQIVIANKLRRRERFAFTVPYSPERGTGRISMWLSPNIPTTFQFDRQLNSQLNQGWLEILRQASNSAQGLTILEEPAS